MRQFDEVSEVRQRLHARHKLYPTLERVIVQLFQLRLGIASAQIAKVGFSVDFIDVVHADL